MKLANLITISKPTVVDTTHLNYPEGTNYDTQKYCCAVSTHRGSEDFEVTIYEIGNAAKCKTFHFRNIDRLHRVLKHFDSLTSDQIKDFLKEKK